MRVRAADCTGLDNTIVVMQLSDCKNYDPLILIDPQWQTREQRWPECATLWYSVSYCTEWYIYQVQCKLLLIGRLLMITSLGPQQSRHTEHTCCK